MYCDTCTIIPQNIKMMEQYITRCVARNLQLGGGLFWGLGDPSAAGGQWGSVSDAPSRQRLGD